MSLAQWAIKPTELARLSRTSLLVWAARVAMRTEPWRPPGATPAWNRGLRLLAATPVPAARALARELADRGADACNRRDGRPDEALGRCMNYATCTLSLAVEATLLPDGRAFLRALVDVAKHAGSIPAVLAHAGLVRAPARTHPVDHAAGTFWSTLRADLPTCAAVTAPLSVPRIRAVAPLWPPGTPAWAR